MKKRMVAMAAAAMAAWTGAAWGEGIGVSMHDGDANCDKVVDLSDAILVMQVATNPDKYGVSGTDPTHITEQGVLNADLDGKTGLSNADALLIQKYILSLNNYDLVAGRGTAAHRIREGRRDEGAVQIACVDGAGNGEVTVDPATGGTRRGMRFPPW